MPPGTASLVGLAGACMRPPELGALHLIRRRIVCDRKQNGGDMPRLSGGTSIAMATASAPRLEDRPVGCRNACRRMRKGVVWRFDASHAVARAPDYDPLAGRQAQRQSRVMTRMARARASLMG